MDEKQRPIIPGISRQNVTLFLIGGLILLGLYFSSLYSYLLFHSLVELFSIAVACGIFMVAWNSRRFYDSGYLLFIGIAYLFIGVLDLVHTLAYKGMGVFEGYDANLPTQLWIAARYTESVSLIVASLFIGKKLRSNLAFLGYTVFTALLLVSIFYWPVFPDCFIEGSGLTPFKKISEYVISSLLIVSIVLLFRKREKFDASVLRFLVASIVVTIGSELAFTFYIDVYGFSNLVGHFFKVISVYLIYKALVETGLIKPYALLFRDLKQSETALQRANWALWALSECNQAVVRVEQESELLREICRIVVEVGGYRLAWVGFAEQDEGKTVRPEAQVGFEQGYLETLNITWADTERGRGPTGTAIRTGRPYIANNIPTDPGFAPWRVEATRRGYESSIALPLLADKEAFGALNIYAPEPDGFDADEVQLLADLADNLAFGILALRTRAERKQAEESLLAEKAFTEMALNSQRDTFFVFDPASGKALRWNQAFCEASGYSDKEIASMKAPDEWYSKKDLERAAAATEKIFQEGQATVEMSLITKDGSLIPFEYTASFMMNTEGDPQYLIAVGRDVTKRKQAERVLRESEERLRTIYESAMDAMFVIDMQGRYTDVNPAGCRMFGYTREEFLASDIRLLLFPEEADQVVANSQTMWREGSFIPKARLRKKDGSELLGEMTIAPFEIGGEAFALGILRDITERVQAQEQIKASLAEKEVLVREIHHRVKNNLQSLIYLIDMQAKTVQAPETLRALEDLQGRARAMAIVHGKLYQAHDLARIDFGVYLKDLTSQLFLALGGRRHITLRVEADSLFISVDTAIPCGLIINELMTNALKYAFPKDRARNENRENEIRVAFCMDKGEYVLTVSDNGVGMPPDLDWRTTNSLGLKLVNIWATHQLEGSIKVDAVDGTAFTIKFSRRK